MRSSRQLIIARTIKPEGAIIQPTTGRSSDFRIIPKLHLPALFAVVFRNSSTRLQRRDRDGISPCFPILRNATSDSAPVSYFSTWMTFYARKLVSSSHVVSQANQHLLVDEDLHSHRKIVAVDDMHGRVSFNRWPK